MCRGTYVPAVSALSAIAELDQPGHSIRARRMELGWTQAELSKRSGITQADISRLENGHLDARWSTIHRLSLALTGEHPRRRSLANGGQRSAPADNGKVWKPRAPIATIER